jgi:hypothetical protein
MLSNATKYLRTSPEDGELEFPEVVVNYDVTAGTKYLVACDSNIQYSKSFRSPRHDAKLQFTPGNLFAQ